MPFLAHCSNVNRISWFSLPLPLPLFLILCHFVCLSFGHEEKGLPTPLSAVPCPARQSFICFVFGALRCPQNENGNWFSRFLAVLDLAPAREAAMATITTTAETTTLI